MVTGWGTAAKIVGCSPTQLRRLVARGTLPAEKGEDGCWQFQLADLETLKLEQKSPRNSTVDQPQGETEDELARAGHPDVASSGAMQDRSIAVEACRRLDEGENPVDLVMALGIHPDQARALFEAWRSVRIAGQQADSLRDAIKLQRRLQDDEWTFDEFTEAFDEVLDATEMYQDEGFTSEDALELLRTVREREMPLAVAVEALRHLPIVERQQALARQAQSEARHAEQRIQAAQDALGRLQQEIDMLWPQAHWLRLSKALAALVAREDGAVQELRDALALAPFAGTTMADHMLQHVAPRDEADARRQLAIWAASELQELVMLRSGHEAEMKQALQAKSMNDVLFGMAMSRMSDG